MAATGQPGRVEVLLRRRMELLPSDGSIPRFVYHEAAELDAGGAAALVKRAAGAARKAARAGVEEILDELRRLNVTVEAVGVPTGSTKVPADLAAVLRAHPLIHAAEGQLIQQAVSEACDACGLEVVTGRERDLWPMAAEAHGVTAAALRQGLDDLRKILGPPWSADQKIATAAALWALGECRTTAGRRGGSRGHSRN